MYGIAHRIGIESSHQKVEPVTIKKNGANSEKPNE
jgi:hypothetical protein